MIFRAGRCVHRRLALGAPVVYSSAMPFRRIARTSLSLLVAYAIVLGGVLSPAVGHGFDPSMQLCAPGGGEATSGPAQDSPQTRALHECCLALCGGQPVILSPAAGAARTVFYTSLVWAPYERRTLQTCFVQTRSARAPPLG
jgi:hypothetical protein